FSAFIKPHDPICTSATRVILTSSPLAKKQLFHAKSSRRRRQISTTFSMFSQNKPNFIKTQRKP
ncbi:MAG: hypothetical protein IKV00_05885, partial [Clostridia bacterium]|nr:hypothetical protein [Clostridia bacterium]